MAKKIDIFRKLSDIQHNDPISQICDVFFKESLNADSYAHDTSASSLDIPQHEMNSNDSLVEKETAKRRIKQSNANLKLPTKNAKTTSKRGKIKTLTVANKSLIHSNNAYNTIKNTIDRPLSNGTRRSLRLLEASAAKGNQLALSETVKTSKEPNSINEIDDSITVINHCNVPNNDTEYPNSEVCDGRRRVMRGRRRYLAEKVAQCTQIDHIDLIKSPTVSISKYVDLTSDTEDHIEKQTLVDSRNVNVHLPKEVIDEQNCEINIRINWMNRIQHFPLRKHQKFKYLFELLADREQIHPHRILLNINDRILNMNDTPDSVDYKCFQCIYGRVMDSSYFMDSNPKFKKAGNVLLLKIQSTIWKRPIHFDILKSETFHILYIKCAEEAKQSINDIKLSINGEVLEHDATPIDLELEDGEVIDLNLRK